MPTKLSVNVNKIAVLRNSRGGLEPDVLKAVDTIIQAGAQGITVHPRPDLRHIKAADVLAIAEALPAQIEFNIEGNPLAPANQHYPGLLELLAQTRPAQVTLVPDTDGQITSDHGFDPKALPNQLAAWIAKARAFGCRISVFVDAELAVDDDALKAFRDIGCDRIEIYTGPFAAECAQGGGVQRALIQKLCEQAEKLGLGVNAGHDLAQSNVRALLEAAPSIAEVSIGHALISEALYDGLCTTVRRYLELIQLAQASQTSSSAIAKEAV
jgi:pyridoxine 5-phosphate synthase